MPKKKIRKQKIQTEPVKPIDPSDAAAETEESALPDEPQKKHFPIVGIGASAGGLAAFEAFFSAMPADTDPGMAFVLVQHLAPDHKSILTNLIRQYTRMKVFEVEDGMDVQPNCAYIIPPNRDMAFLNGRLQLLEPSAPRGHRMPIDFFFRSLAHDQRDRSICIVLSGTGSDGTLGLRAVKGEGGMVMAQTPESAEYDGMPRSAIATGLVDYELAPAEMPVRLMAYAAHAFVRSSRPEPKAENALKKIFILMRGQTGHDFSQYKPSTILRRIERRMAVHQIDTMDEYVRYLQVTPPEVESLFNDFLIGVTGFFRDAKAFRVLEEQVIPRLFAGRSGGTAVRVWCPGCSSGEEAYSIAILLEERMNALKQSFNVQIFATDIDSLAIETGRAGLYPASIAADISRERLEHFFTAAPGGTMYRIRKNIRDMLIFSEQDLIKDPPFSKLDLISCRNVLIYMDGDLQKKIIPLFHYALNSGGFLFLGTSETVGDFSDLFAVQDRKAKLYQRRPDIHSTRTALSHFMPSLVAGQQNAGKKIFPAKVPLRELTEQSTGNDLSLACQRAWRHPIFTAEPGISEPALGELVSAIS
ncbi:MAG: chemotaxis protein CheB [Desulfobacterales bacterium]